MITLLNCKSVRKKAGLLLVCGYYTDGSRVLLCFVFACFSFFMVHQIYILIFYFLWFPAGSCSLSTASWSSGSLLLMRPSAWLLT